MTIHSSEPRSASFQAITLEKANLFPIDAKFPISAPDSELSSRSESPTEASSSTTWGERPIVNNAQAGLLRDFIKSYRETESYKQGSSIPLTGDTLSISAVTAVARYPGLVSKALSHLLDDVHAQPGKVEELARSRDIIDTKLAQNKSIYGVSTGFGGSADTRTADHDSLGLALLQHQHAGVLPSALADIADANAATGSPATSQSPAAVAPLPLTPPLSTSSMPPSWVRAALVVRLNSLLRGHSAASLPLLGSMASLLEKNVTPMVPLRGTISASGDLSPLSYVAGTLIGERGIYCWAPGPEKPIGPAGGLDGVGIGNGMEGMEGAATGLRIMRAPDALSAFGLKPLKLRPKEHLAILNGTAFSCGTAALCVDESRQMILLGMACTAMGTEAMRGTSDSFCPFIQKIRPHPGQIEAGALMSHVLVNSKLATSHFEQENKKCFSSHDDVSKDSMEEETIDADAGVLRQDRYPLRTAPQWLGPQAEIVQRAADVISIECNSTTDNPLIEPETGIVHHGGNFQAMAVTMALEPLRLALHHVGKILFAQSTELCNSSMNNGLGANLAATDPSLNFFGKGIDIAQAAYVAELAYLANPVSTGVQSAEMHNQAVNSLALVNARYTLQSLDVLQMLTASYLYLLCQAVDLRSIQRTFEQETRKIITGLLMKHFTLGSASATDEAKAKVADAVWTTFDTSANMDAKPRTEKAARASTQPIVDLALSSSAAVAFSCLAAMPAFQTELADMLYIAYKTLTRAYLEDSVKPGAPRYMPAAPLLGRTRALYSFIRGELSIGMHGRDNIDSFAGGLGSGDWEADRPSRDQGRTIGGDVSLIYESIRDGRLRPVLVSMFEGA